MTETHNYQPGLRLGILGGGQLGRMMLQAAIDYDLHVAVLDPDPAAACAPLAHRFVHGHFTDYDTVMAFGKDCQLLTIEIENVNTQALHDLQALGVSVYPQPQVIELIRDKRRQKQFYADHGIATSPFACIDNREEARQHAHLFPAFSKLGTGGYDGKGVQFVAGLHELDKVFDAPGLIEQAVDIENEIAIIAARNPQGEIVLYPTVEMVFHPTANLVEYLQAPAQITAAQEEQARALALTLVQKLEIVGLLAVEMFIDKQGQVLVNEVAPRPHNSGHHTMKAAPSSQFEQHLRAIMGLPLGQTDMGLHAAMLNVLGAEWQTGAAAYTGVAQACAVPGVYLTLYGKGQVNPFRKMGHLTIIAPTAQELEQRVARVKNLVTAVAQ